MAIDESILMRLKDGEFPSVNKAEGKKKIKILLEGEGNYQEDERLMGNEELVVKVRNYDELIDCTSYSPNIEAKCLARNEQTSIAAINKIIDSLDSLSYFISINDEVKDGEGNNLSHVRYANAAKALAWAAYLHKAFSEEVNNDKEKLDIIGKLHTKTEFNTDELLHSNNEHSLYMGHFHNIEQYYGLEGAQVYEAYM